MRHVYVHGSGRTGAQAWPTIDPSSGTFVAFDKDAAVPERVAVLEAEHAGSPLTVFAHSLGGVPAALAAHRGVLDVRALVLVEPALYDVARGHSAIERHIAIVTEARAQAAAGDLRAFWALMRPLMFGGPLEVDRWSDERAAAEHWARVTVPWGHGVRPGMLRGIPTLVVTGGWNAEYEAIASVLVDNGGSHQVVAGAQHRPQDLPGFGSVVAAFLRTVAEDLRC
ncbi:alpha/beta fold hydrolase [Microbacterium protaetiae]|uniref:Alpha/beta fold hydrolase n=1 Tax=Microbacterium protaetiae TaxID=2509458 RepID=A0A4P6EFI5_9MICO|nr:alpha/beta fold hydrolase [Microbacterium protaetiae]QAY61132.1 alpha/beta fold hydrolase [Microbacterium protaetiae]